MQYPNLMFGNKKKKIIVYKKFCLPKRDFGKKHSKGMSSQMNHNPNTTYVNLCYFS